jgi:hypothetical protein
VPAPRPTLKLLSARIGRWPRRIAALACLLLAAGSTLVPQAPSAVTAHEGIAARLHRAEVAVPLPISTLPPDLVRPGDHVGVLATSDEGGPATLVADGLRVLSLRTDSSAMTTDSATVVVVAARRSDAVALARFSTGRLVLMVDKLP